jgi:HEPN domain-containing protein
MNNINFFGGKVIMSNIVMNAQNVRVSGVSIGAENLTESLYQRLLDAEREKVKILQAALNQEFPIQELVSDCYVTEEQAAEMTALTGILSEKYDLSHIICFARKGIISNNFSVFADIPSFIRLHYFFLFVTKSTERVEHEIQDYINAHYKSFNVIAIAHSFETVRNAISQGNRFFIAGFIGGLEMYNDNKTTFEIEFPKLNQTKILEKAEKRFHDHNKMATGFLNSASICIRIEEYYENGVFMLHQAVEQACISLIKVHMGYRIDLHNLTRLLHLCKCFSEKPAELFLAVDDESIRLFKILRESYGNARYAENFKITAEDAITILEKVDVFVSLAENLCLDWINGLRTRIAVEKEKIVNELTPQQP